MSWRCHIRSWNWVSGTGEKLYFSLSGRCRRQSIAPCIRSVSARSLKRVGQGKSHTINSECISWEICSHTEAGSIPETTSILGTSAYTIIAENAKFAGPSDRRGYFLSGSGKHPSITGPCDRQIVHCSPFLPHACAKLHLQWVCQKASGSAKNLVSAGPVVWHIKKSFRILCYTCNLG